MRYTGQAIIVEASDTNGIGRVRYSYKAHIYAPKLGRFLQTDPIAAADGSFWLWSTSPDLSLSARLEG